MLCRLLCSALRAHVHEGHVAADGSTDGSPDGSADLVAHSCAYGSAYCGAHCGADTRADIGTHCNAVGEAHSPTDGRTDRCTNS